MHSARRSMSSWSSASCSRCSALAAGERGRPRGLDVLVLVGSVEQPQPPREPRRRARLHEERHEIASATTLESSRRGAPEAREHADERRGHDAGLARPAEERELGRDHPPGGRAPRRRTTVSGRATRSSTAITASAGPKWSTSVWNGRFAPTTGTRRAVTMSASVARRSSMSCSCSECMASPSSSMLPTTRPGEERAQVAAPARRVERHVEIATTASTAIGAESRQMPARWLEIVAESSDAGEEPEHGAERRGRRSEVADGRPSGGVPAEHDPASASASTAPVGSLRADSATTVWATLRRSRDADEQRDEDRRVRRRQHRADEQALGQRDARTRTWRRAPTMTAVRTRRGSPAGRG